MALSRKATASAVVWTIVFTLVGPGARKAPAQEPLRVGLTGSLLQELPGASSPLAALALPSSTIDRLAERQTGVPMRVTAADHDRLGRLLDDGELDFGVFHGVEFAWARQKYPRLRPLTLVVNERPELRACLLVRRGSGLTDFAALRARSCALATCGRQHCALFVESCCRRCGATSAGFFSRLVTPSSVDRAIEAVVKGEVDATVVDEVAVECYGEEKPGRFARLEVLQQSEVFPATVVAYAEGALDRPAVHRLRNSLLQASRSPRIRAGLTLCRLTGFAAVPGDYETRLEEIAVAYRPPARESPLEWLLASASRLASGFPTAQPRKASTRAPRGTSEHKSRDIAGRRDEAVGR